MQALSQTACPAARSEMAAKAAKHQVDAISYRLIRSLRAVAGVPPAGFGPLPNSANFNEVTQRPCVKIEREHGDRLMKLLGFDTLNEAYAIECCI